ncbi:MAG: phosphoesterase [Candidatus Hydrogenedentota bacterium]|nr:MAG: phosphoesterase [Candidatus Hydrogenedentota bacterium]
MEILYLTDIHDDLKNLRYVIQTTDADAYIISGDLIYKAFFTEDKLYHFLEVQEDFYAYIKRNALDQAPYELAMDILESPHRYPGKIRSEAAEYRMLFQQAAVNMKEKYATIRDLIQRYTNRPVMMIPGNYDMDLQYTALYDLDMHKNTKVIDGIRFSGYGGAPIITPGIPEMLSVAYYEDMQHRPSISEPRDFLIRENPHVAILHNPAYGTLDKLPRYGHCGSLGVREYIDEKSPVLVLSGHVHEDYGLLRIGETFFLNPSNFGATESLTGIEDGGTYCKFELKKKNEKVYLSKVIWYRLVGRDHIAIAEVHIDFNLRASQEILNEIEFAKFERFLR